MAVSSCPENEIHGTDLYVGFPAQTRHSSARPRGAAQTGSPCHAVIGPESARHRPARDLPRAVENIDHTRTKVKSPQTNGICERFHKTLLDEFYRVAFRKKV